MSHFVHIDYPSTHPGVERFRRVAGMVSQTWRGFDGARGAATLLLAAVVSALLVAANEVVEAWTEGHLLAAWIAMWVVGFAALALFADPARRAVTRARVSLAAWGAARRQAAEDEKLWNAALADARVMADLSRAMTEVARRQLSALY